MTDCGCAEIAGENPRCILHGEGTRWAKENPDLCEFSERYADMKAALARVIPLLAEASAALAKARGGDS